MKTQTFAVPGALDGLLPDAPAFQSITLGVGADHPSTWAGPTTARFVLTASLSAPLVTHESVGVTVEGPGGFRATQFVNLTVED